MAHFSALQIVPFPMVTGLWRADEKSSPDLGRKMLVPWMIR
ncbi:hypothetical protein [Desulfopila inferna]|nr:hypothetical protein [Desulfopila inferna]